MKQEAVVAEWLRRLTRNQIPSGSAGSSPADRGRNFFHTMYAQRNNEQIRYIDVYRPSVYHL